ncbi:hypothetical protein MF672_019385 [Actinomadura sp. ATCC 31491]|uniref:Uncharacterized protein n=1 Tax=Actinomadura luzonensis TaxID=2805427 RepID=A0ABT0FUD1_9ACTN|nr:hypothetical protein [Actinomadura luzonensis]MCK2215942.1 hypothetical protein [Actinomadura luzonensis]
MAGPRKVPRGSIARLGVVALVLLSMVLAACTNAGSAGAGRAPAAVSHSGWTPDGLNAELSSLPPAHPVAAREHHVLPLWPPLRGDRRTAAAARLALLPATRREPAAFRDPQQLGHCAAGSRSPPLI